MEELESVSETTEGSLNHPEQSQTAAQDVGQTGDAQREEPKCSESEAPSTPLRDRVEDPSLDSRRTPSKEGSEEVPSKSLPQPPGEVPEGKQNVAKPKKKPPLFRTKVSNENLGESIPRLTRQASQEEPPPPPKVPATVPAADRALGRRKSNGSRNKFLLRGQQVSDDSSPPPTPDIAIHIQQSEPPSVSRFPHQHSGDGPSLTPFIKQSSYEARSEPALSREPSQEKEFTDSKGVNLQQFIIDTLRKPQDRTMLLHLEKELVDLVNSSASEKKFGPMSSYHRMIVHRVAAYFGLDHNVDQTGKTVIVEKTISTRIPEKRFKEHIQDDLMLEGPARTILKRDTASCEEKYYYDHSDRSDIYSRDDKKSKSFEERQEQYDKARARIFKQSSSGQESLTVDSPTRPRAILHLGSRQSSGASDDSSYWKQERPWSSVDSSGSDRPNVPVITKASSFGGSSRSGTMLMRVDSGGSSQSTGSPSSGSVASSSSGSKLQENPDGSISGSSSHSTLPHPQQRVGGPPQHSSSYIQYLGPVLSSESVSQGPGVSWSGTVSSAPSHHSHYCMTSILSSGGQAGLPPSHQQPVLFIAPNLESVPPGCIIVNPQSGQPYLNKDGTPVVYQPVTQQLVQQPHPPAAHLPTPGGGSQQQPPHHQPPQQMVAQPCQHSTVYPPQQSIHEGQLTTCAPHILQYGPPPTAQPTPLQMNPISTGDYQDLQGQFVSLNLVPQEGEGSSPHHISQIPQGGSHQHQQSNPQHTVSHGMMQAMKGPVATVIKGSPGGHDMSQPYPAVQQTQQISYAAHLPLPPDGQAGCFHHQAPSPQTSMQQLCQQQPPSVQSQPMGLPPQQGLTQAHVYYPSQQQEGQPDTHGKPQTIFTQGGYPVAVPAAGSHHSQHQPQFVYISEKPLEQQYVEQHQQQGQSVPTFVPSSQGATGSQFTASSSVRDAIRPASPQTIPAGYSVPLLHTHHVLGQPRYPPHLMHVPRMGSHPQSYQVVPGPGTLVRSTHPGAVLQPQTQGLANQMVPGESIATRKEMWRPPSTYQSPQYRHHITEEGSEEVLEVSQLPRDLSCQAVLPLLEDIAQFGAKICWVPKTAPAHPNQAPSQPPGTKLVSDFTILAVFPTPELAQKAVFNSANASYSLQQPGKNYFPLQLGGE